MNGVNKTIRMLAIISMLANVPDITAETTRPERTNDAKVVFMANGETHNQDYAEGEMYVAPEATTKIGDSTLQYKGMFREAADSDGGQTGLQTITHTVSASNDDWDLTLGRKGMRSFGGTTTTVGFDNYMAGKGFTRNFTGTFATYKPWGITAGVASTDTTMSPSHWDMLVGSWSHRFDDCVGVQTHLAATEDHVEKAGLAVEWKTNDRLSLLMDCVYGRSSSSALIAADFQASKDIMLFAGAEATMPKDDDATGKIVAGVEGNLGHGCKAVGAVEQGVGPDSDTKVVLGFKFKNTKDLL